MKQSLLLYAIILVLSGLLIYNTYQLKNHGKTIESSLLKLNSTSTELNYCNSFLRMYEMEISQYFNYGGYQFDDDFLLYDMDTKEEVLLKDLDQEFFLAFDEGSCESCVEQEIHKLKSDYKGLGDRVAILTTKRSDRELKLMKSRLKIPFKVYVTERLASDFDVLGGGQPFYFFVNDQLICNRLFIVNDDHPKLNNAYLDYLNRELSIELSMK
ncbi:MAG: hypothetical protein AAFP19_07000 [Bacteroidota bacterium]